jgi:hypothetical protein
MRPSFGRDRPCRVIASWTVFIEDSRFRIVLDW